MVVLMHAVENTKPVKLIPIYSIKMITSNFLSKNTIMYIHILLLSWPVTVYMTSFITM